MSVIEDYWREFSAGRQLPADAWLYPDPMVIGSTVASANRGAGLILDGIKTATSGATWEFTRETLPRVGMFSVVLDGQQRPVCVVRTTWVQSRRVSDVDVEFARDYGEFDRTLETWRVEMLGYYGELAQRRGETFGLESELVCERFAVIR